MFRPTFVSLTCTCVAAHLCSDLLTAPPGFASGMDFAPAVSGVTSSVPRLPSDHATIDLANILGADDIIDWTDDDTARLSVPVQVHLNI